MLISGCGGWETKDKCAEYRLVGSEIVLVPGHPRNSEPRLEILHQDINM